MVGIVKEVAATFFHLDISMELLATQDTNGAEYTSWRICESGVIRKKRSEHKMTSPAQMSQEAKKKLKAASGKCPFQSRCHPDESYANNERTSPPRMPSSTSASASDTVTKDPCPSKIICAAFIPKTREKAGMSSASPEGLSDKKTNIQEDIFDRLGSRNVNRLNSRNHDSHFVEQRCDFGLSGKQLTSVFPFHIVFNKDLTILQCGHELHLFLNTELVGKQLDDIFHVTRPCSIRNWRDFTSKTKSENVFMQCVLNLSHEPLQLSGTAVCDDNDEIMTVLCSPNAKNLLDMKNQGLTMTDIPKTDCRYEMILTTEHLQSETNAIARMTAMSEQLEKEREIGMRLMQEAAENAESALAIKRSFVRYVSHEIRTPLTVSMLGLDLIAEELEDLGAGESTMSNIGECQDSINIAVSILNDLLSYEKLESGILEISASYVPMTGFICKCLRPFKLQARQKDVIFSVDDKTQEDIDNPFFINVDMTKMSQVIRNLTSNAIKFTPPGGSVRVVMSTYAAPTTTTKEDKTSEDDKSSETTSSDFHVVEIDGKEYPLAPQGWLLLEFIDTGVGISEYNQEKVFREIVQFSPNELQAGGGSGLGLWISRGLVELHEGQIGMESDGVGHGSTFFVKIPVYGCNGEDIIPSIGSGEAQSSDDSICENTSGVDFQICEKSALLTASNGDHTVLGSSSNLLAESAPRLLGGKVEMPRKGLVRTYSKTSSNSENDEIDIIILNGLKILVVDDAAMIRKLFKRLLDGHGAVCFLAEDGEDCLAKVQQLQYAGCDESPEEEKKHQQLKQQQQQQESDTATGSLSRSHVITPPSGGGELNTYDLILMDFIMPVMDGPTATTLLRQSGYKGLIVGVTGNMMPSDVSIFEDAGASAVFAKPLELHKLVRYLNLHLDFECCEVL